jgi:hypothetical protein
MIATHRAAGRVVVSFAQQIGASVVATLAATALLTTLHGWHAPVRPMSGESAPPQLTSGGKYAARAAADHEANDLVTMVELPSILPMFTAPAVPALDVTPALSAGPLADTPAAAAPLARTAARRTPPRIPLPPRPDRMDSGVIRMAALPALPAAEATDPSLWERSKALYGSVANWGGAVVNKLVP